GVGQLLADVAAQLGQEGVVVPLAGADEVLQGAALLAGLVGDRLGGLALQPGELAAEDRGGVGALLGAVEQRQGGGREGGCVAAGRRGGSGAELGRRARRGGG